ncbi:MAG: HD domain-containing protein [Candidatus Caenarcaniphilales bacterium]|nr:HD domain-containing protein [Candidatus Caenarcaniphilales bacterium]
MNILGKLPNSLVEALSCSESYLVGGGVRDSLLGKDVSDFDFVVFDVENLANLSRSIADRLSCSFVELDDQHQIYRIVGKKWQADLSAPRGQTLELDLAARDFTINSIAFDIRSNDLVDPYDGVTALKSKTIRALAKKNLEEDPLRALRAFRFMAQIKDFEIEKRTIDWIKEMQSQIKLVSSERVSFELWTLLTQEKSYPALWEMLKSGLVESIMPEMIALRKVPSNDFHHLPLLEHTFELIRQYEDIVLYKIPDLHQGLVDERLGQVSLVAVLKMACLLHDIAKPQTWVIKDGRHTFYGHDQEGAKITHHIGIRLRWSKQVIQLVSDLVRLHLRPFCIAPSNGEPTEKAQSRLFRKMGSHFPLLIALAWADTLSTKGPAISDELVLQNENRLQKLLTQFYLFQHQEKSNPPLLQGDLLVKAIQTANLPPTAEIKQRLAELRELQLCGKIKSTEEAYDWFVQK